MNEARIYAICAAISLTIGGGFAVAFPDNGQLGDITEAGGGWDGDLAGNDVQDTSDTTVGMVDDLEMGAANTIKWASQQILSSPADGDMVFAAAGGNNICLSTKNADDDLDIFRGDCATNTVDLNLGKDGSIGGKLRTKSINMDNGATTNMYIYASNINSALRLDNGYSIALGSTSDLSWASDTMPAINGSDQDTGIARRAAGLIEPNNGSTGEGYFAMGNVSAAAPAEPFTCDATHLGAIVIVDDSDDTAINHPCICLFNDNGAAYDWRQLSDPVATACPKF